MAFPILPIKMPAVLKGQSNGELDPKILTLIEVSGHPDIRLVGPAARSWVAMAAAAAADGIVLQSTSAVDSYRPYAVQSLIFHQRYSPAPVKGYIATRTCSGTKYYQRPGTAMAACPGHSNHGIALAVDVAGATGARLKWLERNAPRFGWSWEAPSEKWHIRYVTGDAIPAAVLAYEQGDEDMTPAEKAALDNAAAFAEACIAGADTVWHYEAGKPKASKSMALYWDRIAAAQGDLAAVTEAARGGAETGAKAGVVEALDGATVTATIDTSP